jgi:hypothetical protein
LARLVVLGWSPFRIISDDPAPNQDGPIAENRKFDQSPVVSEENIKIQKVNDGRTDDGRPVVANAHMTLKKLLRK